MKAITNTPDYKDKPPFPTNDIFSRSKNLKTGANHYTIPSEGSFLKSDYYKALVAVGNGIRDVSRISGEASSLQEASADLASAILLPPDEEYSTIIPPEGVAAAKQIEEVTKKQFTQQFYETYMVPVGTKDIYNRLGSIAGNVADMHSLYPNGVRGLIAADSKASWRTNLNFAFTVDEGLKDEEGKAVAPAKYSSLAFPPFVGHEALNIKDLTSKILKPDTPEDVAKENSTFDMENILYKGNEGTYRFPAFKQVNDNIHILQVLLNRCFGVESTYINEWDLSLYMQEGLLSFTEKVDSEGQKIKLPQFVTTLTYGLIDDAPIQNKGYELVDFDKITPFASLNCAVSTRYGIDNEAIGQQANTLNYVVAEYPYSAYWCPWDDGITSSVSNMAIYVDEMLSYLDNGEPYNANDKVGRWFTPAIYHGDDLSRSSKTFRGILKYTDCRNAILSGWNSTDVSGNLYMKLSDNTNEAVRSNAFSYLPFWKQFYTNAEDGMSDLDKYIQEIYAKDSETSFLNAAFQILELISGDNEIWNNARSNALSSQAPQQEVKEGGDAIEDDSAKAIAQKYGGVDYSDQRFSLFKCKLNIPGSKLLKMFLNKSSVTSDAKAKADAAGGDSIDTPEANAAAGAANSPSSALRTATPTKVLDNPTTVVVDGQEVEVNSYVPEDDDELCSKKVVGDGIAEWSPFLYGGPHGKFFSPLTLEGYTQVDNETLANVPTVDTHHDYNGGVTLGVKYQVGKNTIETRNVRGLETSKNWKRNGTYADTVTAVTPNERNVLLHNAGRDFGLKNYDINNWHIRSYYSNVFEREAFWEAKAWIYIYREETYWVPDYQGSAYGHNETRLVFDHKEPDYSEYKTYGTLNDKWERAIYDCIEYGTSIYSTRIGQSQWRNTVSSETDWPNTEFMLIPRDTWSNGFNADNYWDHIDSATTRNEIQSDSGRYSRRTTIDSNGNYTWRADSNYPPSTDIRYLIVPKDQRGSTICGIIDRDLNPWAPNWGWCHWDTYSQPYSSWYYQLQRLYNAGTHELEVTLPIKDTAGNVISIVCGIATIEKSEGICTTTKWIYRGYRRWRAHSSWWWWGWWGCPHWLYYYIWDTEIVHTYNTTYNMYFRPEKVKWNLPTKTLIENEARYTALRNKSSANIVERWCVDGAGMDKTFSHISDPNDINSPDLFPFTWKYQEKYGYYDANLPLPGVTNGSHKRPANDVRTLHTTGFFYGDILNRYKETGNVQYIASIYPVYETYTGPASYWDLIGGPHYNLGDKTKTRTIRYSNSYGSSYSIGCSGNYYWGYYYNYSWYNWWYWYRQNNIIQRYWVYKEDNFFWTDYTPTWQPQSYGNVDYLTNILNDAQHWPAIQTYRIDSELYMNWYKPKDTIEVFIDTATQQIAWLKQLRDYADLYISDKLIYEVYQKGTDLKIQNIMKYHRYGNVKNIGSEQKNYRDGCGGWTTSFSEDINYHDALALVERVFNQQDASKNTIRDLTQDRIDKLEALKAAAIGYRDVFDTDNNCMNNFIELVTNTKSYLDGAVTGSSRAEDALFSAYYDATGKHYSYNPGLFEVNANTVYDMTRNPGALLWAYLNVLYQVRKYWVNLRLNKRAGSYWNLRGLERVLTFLLAESTGEDTPESPERHIPQGTLDEAKTKNIIFVQTRDSFLDQVQSDKSISATETHAVYVKVNYLGVPEPTKTSKWDEATQRYNGEEIVYVPEAYRWAKKPQDGLYYIMSKAIIDSMSNYSNLLKSSVNMIFAKTYKVTEDDYNQVLGLMEQTPNIDYSRIYSNDVKDFTAFKQYLDTLAPVGKTISELNKTAEEMKDLASQTCLNVAILFAENLLTFKKNFYMSKIQSCLYGIYIRWSPQHVWTGLSEDDVNGTWHIDEWQRQETLGKSRTVTDLYGIDHESKEAISAGITFDVAAAVDAGTLLSSPAVLKDSTLLEVLCSSVDKMDLWRIEIPNDVVASGRSAKGLHIPAKLLSEKPVLVPAYEIDASLNGLKTGRAAKSTKTVLAGVASTSILPVLEPTEAMLSINTLSALGKFEDISKTGLSVEAITDSGN